jgi:putative Holliday junction resolvase
MARLLGLDYGTVRVGVALGDEETRLARPLATLDARRGLLENLREIIRREGIARVVLGRPLRARGEPGTLDGTILHFAEVLRGLGVEVLFQDEGGSSLRAEALLHEAKGRRGARSAAGTRRERREGGLDRAAAALLLQEHLDSLPAAGQPQGDPS